MIGVTEIEPVDWCAISTLCNNQACAIIKHIKWIPQHQCSTPDALDALAFHPNLLGTKCRFSSIFHRMRRALQTVASCITWHSMYCITYCYCKGSMLCFHFQVKEYPRWFYCVLLRIPLLKLPARDNAMPEITSPWIGSGEECVTNGRTTNVDLPPILTKQTLAEFQSDIHCVCAVHMEWGKGENGRGKPLLLFARADPGSILNGEPHTWGVVVDMLSFIWMCILR